MTPRDSGYRPDRSYDDAIGVVSARRRKRRATMRKRQNRRLIAAGCVALGVVFLAIIAAGTAGAGLAAYHVVDGLHLATMKADYPGVNSRIYWGNGKLMYKVPSAENRLPVTSRHISPWLKKATVDIEDKRFYEHGGVDYEAIARAAVDDFNAGHVVQGASTIEQQVVRNLYLDRDVSATRKLKEAWLAMQMANTWPKDHILTTYLNIAPYGGVTFGCEAAAETYFSKHCHDLGVTQSALLAGLPQAPTTYNPVLHPRAARARRNAVLRAMWQNHDLTRSQFVRAANTGLRLRRRHQAAGKLSYFAENVLAQIKTEYGASALDQGLEIHTTLDPRLQADAEAAMHGILNAPGDPSAAMVSIDPRTGAILAYGSTTNPAASKYDIAGTGRRQAGSSFKPFGLMAAMIYNHMDPETQRYSADQPFVAPLCSESLPTCTWTVYNAEPSAGGNYNLHVAMDGSINAVFARLSTDIGAGEIVRMAHRLGIPKTTALPVVPSIVLGTGGVSPLDMAGAYATFASGGIRHAPIAITDVHSSYAPRYDHRTPASKNPGRRVIPAWAASEMNKILYDNIYTCPDHECTGGGGQLPDGRAAAGKTGTVEEHQDAWFCGYTPVLATCVWMGFPKGDSDAYSMNSSVGPENSFGGGYPTTIWNRYMSRAFTLEPGRFPATSFAVVSAPAGFYQHFHSKWPLDTPPKPKKTPKKAGQDAGGKDAKKTSKNSH